MCEVLQLWWERLSHPVRGVRSSAQSNLHDSVPQCLLRSSCLVYKLGLNCPCETQIYPWFNYSFGCSLISHINRRHSTQTRCGKQPDYYCIPPPRTQLTSLMAVTREESLLQQLNEEKEGDWEGGLLVVNESPRLLPNQTKQKSSTLIRDPGFSLIAMVGHSDSRIVPRGSLRFQGSFKSAANIG